MKYVMNKMKIALVAGATMTCAAALSADRLADGFAAPPADAKPQAWWHWNNGNISKEGITADLEAMASAGIGGAHIFDVDSGTPLGPVRFNTPEWDAMALHAHREAQRLGLKLTLANCSGYSSSGGPWVTAADAMKCVTWTETAAAGGRHLSLALPQPADCHGWYRDIAVFAVRKPAAERHLMDEPGAKVERTSPAKNTYRYDIVLPRKAKASAFTYTTESSVVWGHTVEAVVECRGADGTYREVGRTKDFVCYGGSVNRLPRFANFPAAESDAWRLTFTFAGYVPERCKIVVVDLGEFQRFHDLGKKVLDAPFGRDSFSPLADTVDPRFAIDVKDVILLNDRFGDGKLEWDAPEGEWTILRIGAAANGTVCAPATPGGVGFEVDKFDRKALRRHFDAFVGRIAKMCGIDPKSDPAKRSGIVASLIDSYEVGGQNWTARFPEEFRRRRGYDVVCAYLPALTGRIIGSVAETDKFLADFRETCAELFREEYAQAFTEYCHASGLQSVVESYGDAPAPRFTFADECDLPMTEFWLYGVDRVQVPNAVTGVVAQARRNGRRIVQSESFTSFPADDNWKQPLWAYKAQGDRIYAAGVNRIVYHRFAHQPWVDVHKRPGMTMGAWGTHFERTQTYWPYVGDWIRYQSRCQFLLQEGEFVRADAFAEPAWTCRRYEDGSMGWFVASTSDVPHRVCIDLGSVPVALKGSVPEVWDPETGHRQQAASFERKGDRLCVNLDFEWRDSVFVMLRPARLESAPYHDGSPRHVQATVPVAGPWEVSFDREMGGPGQVEFPSLVSWPDRSEPGIRYYSGTAVYRKTVSAPELKAGERLELDLGDVRELAQVKVNGKALPVLWKKPYRVDVTEAAAGAKELKLEIDVVNLWPNRMIGDAALPKEKRYTFSVYEPWKANDPLLPSGLLGPVRFGVIGK